MTTLEAPVDRCRSCHAPIRWVRTRRGELMPLDADPVADGNVILDDDGRAVVLGNQLPLAQPTRYRPHFASCPHADQWRTKHAPTERSRS